MKLMVITCGTMLCAGTLHAQQWQHQWQVSDHPSLKLSIQGVDLVVEPGPSNVIEAVLESDGWTALKSADKVVQHQSGDTVSLDVRAQPFLGVRFVHLHLRVPQNMEAELRSGSGSIALRGLHGRVQITTGSGGIDADNIDGSLEASTTSGAMHIRGRFDSLNLYSHSGGIGAEVAAGSRLISDWRIETDAGSNVIKVFPALAAEVEAHTERGRIRSALTLRADGLQTKRQIQGKLNGGGQALKISSRTGSIRLENL